MLLNGQEISFSYGTQPILEGVSVSVSTGEAVAIVGPSGAGKTTLLSLLGGMQKPLSGSVTVDGCAPERYVSWILQTVNCFPHRSTLDNVALGALADGFPRSEALDIAAEKLDSVGLSGMESVPARQLSGGELQRVVIARGLASMRPFLLADEPTGQLDRATTHVVAQCLMNTRSDRGIVIVTHDDSVAELCDRVYRLVDGVLDSQLER